MGSKENVTRQLVDLVQAIFKRPIKLGELKIYRGAATVVSECVASPSNARAFFQQFGIPKGRINLQKVGDSFAVSSADRATGHLQGVLTFNNQGLLEGVTRVGKDAIRINPQTGAMRGIMSI